ncbi:MULTISPECIES: DinB family protein [unclassified Mumia]|uniref:DinB family protein n=1 Tax=unclassified Mumia TaxID=2621872 RepID=UPI002106A64D|nr:MULTISPECIES: DinB family protein [unclassified Mumia]MDD9349771.1 DinB family protein [Mumia sp.]
MDRTDTPSTVDERTTALTLLRYVRETALAKAEGLPEDLAHATPLATSPLMSIANVINHLRWNEHYWVEVVVAGGEDRAPWSDEHPDGEFEIAAQMTLDDILTGYRQQIAACDAILAERDLDDLTAKPRRDFQPNVRWVVAHLVEETARHNGHLDILRELADGEVGD